jgi:hypothetical protein
MHEYARARFMAREGTLPFVLPPEHVAHARALLQDAVKTEPMIPSRGR